MAWRIEHGDWRSAAGTGQPDSLMGAEHRHPTVRFHCACGLLRSFTPVRRTTATSARAAPHPNAVSAPENWYSAPRDCGSGALCRPGQRPREVRGLARSITLLNLILGHDRQLPARGSRDTLIPGLFSWS